jgi:hypothetical protein
MTGFLVYMGIIPAVKIRGLFMIEYRLIQRGRRCNTFVADVHAPLEDKIDQ